ncbi:MAG TPA: YgcG family protein [Nitrosospira sp.]|nr:YgcG family protein [Nitrosospira sp.]
MNRSWAKTLAFIALLFSAFLASADVSVPPLKSRITDLTGTLSANEAAQLEQKLAAFEVKKGSQIAVLIVPTTQPETIEQYSIRVADAWKLGRKGIDDGAVLLIAKQDRTVRIEVGYGLEGVLPDAIAKRIIEETIVPKLRQGNFAGAIDAAIDKMIGVIQGEPLPPPPARHAERGSASSGAGGVLDNFFFIFIILIVVGRILQSLFGRFIGATLMSVSGGFLGGLLFSSILAGIIIAILAFFLSLFIGSGGGIYRGGPGGWYGGGGFGGRGGGGFGGGGGFSGGGGGFGGGGASGRW